VPTALATAQLITHTERTEPELIFGYLTTPQVVDPQNRPEPFELFCTTCRQHVYACVCQYDDQGPF
jgi:hypothetical protein